MPATQDHDGVIARLISTHGEDGICPTADDWRAIFEVSAGGVVDLVNLLTFAPEVESGDGMVSGAEAYSRYSSGISGAFERAGGELIFFGRVGHTFSFRAGEPCDAVVVTRYPSAAALAELWLDPEFIAAHKNRVDGVARSQAFVFGR